MQPMIKPFYHQSSATLTYVVFDPASRATAIIDPVLDFDLVTGKTSTTIADEIIDYIDNHQLKVHWLLETHAHADHLTAAHYLKQKTGGKTAVGRNIVRIQQTFKSVFNLPTLATDGSQFDRLLDDGDTLLLGEMQLSVITTPGHTDDGISYVIAGNAFIGDTLFMPDSGTARCDFPGGDAALLYDSIQKIYALGDDTWLWICHDYQPGGREVAYKTSVAEQKTANSHLKGNTPRADFIAVRQARDISLELPKLLYPAIQVNIRGGRLPEPENNQRAYLKIPLN